VPLIDINEDLKNIRNISKEAVEAFRNI